MAHAALLSGMALANSGLGMAHGVAAALGIHCRVPHGLACAVMLPVALRINRPLRQFELAELARSLFGLDAKMPAAEAAETFCAQIDALCRRVGVPSRLSALGVRPEQVPDLVRSSRGASMSGNPRELSDAELTSILEAML
jgi:alcohol dehydrogenase class IV